MAKQRLKEIEERMNYLNHNERNSMSACEAIDMGFELLDEIHRLHTITNRLKRRKHDKNVG